MVKVSVIVPVFNMEKYLHKCLGSLVSQTLEELEIIIVNDGSSDGSAEIIEGYAAQFPHKIKAYHKANGGLSDARNFGLEHAIGAFIGFVDGDDEVSPIMFEDLYRLARKHKAEMVMCGLVKVDENGREIEKLPQLPHQGEVIDLSHDFSVFGDIGFFACNKIFRRDLFDNKRFKVGAHFEDIQLIPQLLLHCKTVAQSFEYHYKYLVRQNSISKTHSQKGLDIFQAVQDVEVAFAQSPYRKEEEALKNFSILQGVYSFLAYLAFVKDEKTFNQMAERLTIFRRERGLRFVDLLLYRRFHRNYLLSLPIRKKIYYALYFCGLQKWVRKFI